MYRYDSCTRLGQSYKSVPDAPNTYGLPRWASANATARTAAGGRNGRATRAERRTNTGHPTGLKVSIALRRRARERERHCPRANARRASANATARTAAGTGAPLGPSAGQILVTQLEIEGIHRHCGGELGCVRPFQHRQGGAAAGERVCSAGCWI